MARPLPDLDQAAARGREVETFIDALGGYQAAARALEAAGYPIRWDSLRRYVRGERVAPDDILDKLREMASSRPRWITGRDEKRQRWIVHLHRPRFAARIADGKLAAIDWIDEKPPARRHGMLIADAEAQIVS